MNKWIKSCVPVNFVTTRQISETANEKYVALILIFSNFLVTKKDWTYKLTFFLVIYTEEAVEKGSKKGRYWERKISESDEWKCMRECERERE